MTIYPPLINIPGILIGLAGLIVLAIISGSRKKNCGVRFWIGSGFFVFVSMVGWLILTSYFRLLLYTGGSIQEIYLKDTIADVIAYTLTVCIFLCVEKYRM